MELKIKRIDKELPLPKYAYDNDCAFDLCASKEVLLKKGEKSIIPSGIAVSIPVGYFGNVRDRSGMAAKRGIHTMAGVIDSGYRGEIGVVLINLGVDDFIIEKGMRIAQLIIQKVEQPTIVEVDELENSQRGEKGFGSSGSK